MILEVPIRFFALLDDEGWAPVRFDQDDPRFTWDGGGALADAPVDLAATFDGAMSYSTNTERSFNMTGLRCRAGFTVPRHQHNLRLLMIVFGGELVVEAGDAAPQRVGPGQFCVVEAGTPYTMSAGPDGATFSESFPIPMGELATCWHDGPEWVSRASPRASER